MAHQIAELRGPGGVLKEVVGPGRKPGQTLIYQSRIYLRSTLEVVAIDPDTGDHEVFVCPQGSEEGAWAMAVGPDERLYIGSLPHAHVFRLDPHDGSWADLGRPSDTEQYVWELTVAADGRLYGVTYPSAKLIRVDPDTGATEDLGRLCDDEQYGRGIAASADGFVYAAVGSGRMRLIGYDIAAGEFRDLAPQLADPGFPQVAADDDGVVYGRAGGQCFRFSGLRATAIDESELSPTVVTRLDKRPTPHRLPDGRHAIAGPQTVRVQSGDGELIAEHPVDYRGQRASVFRLALDPNGALWVSGVLPAHFFRVDAATGDTALLGPVGGGEVYSFLADGDRVLAAGYSCLAPLMIYHPGRPFAVGGNDPNPTLVEFAGQQSSWRPMAMTSAGDGTVYLGAVSEYGTLGGPLVVWRPDRGTVEQHFHVIPDQSVVTLALGGGRLIAGTTIGGGGGSHPTADGAVVFGWDPATGAVTFSLTPVAGAAQITDLAFLDERRVFGVADDRTAFVVDVDTREVVSAAEWPFDGVVYNAIARGPDGALWGLARDGVFRLDPTTAQARLVITAPEPVTAGFALTTEHVYYACGPWIYRDRLPL